MRRWLPLAFAACAACRDDRAAAAFVRDVGRVAPLRSLRCHAYDDPRAGFCTASATHDVIASLARDRALEAADALARAPYYVARGAGGCSDQPGFHAPAAIEAWRARAPAMAHDGLRITALLFATERGEACVEVER